MNAQIQSVKELTARVAKGRRLAPRVRENPMDEHTPKSAPLKTDVWLYRMVVGVLGLVILASVIGAIALSIVNKATPEFLVALGSAAVGGLAGLLAPSPKDRQ